MASSAGGRIYKISLRIAPDQEDAATELLEEIFEQPPVVETDLEGGTTDVSVYLTHRPSPVLIDRVRLDKATFHFARLQHEDWAESWKRHFKPLAIGRRLLLLPSWSRRKPRNRQAVVVLDPGLSFGTGQHPTTRFCLEQIVTHPRGSLLDLGTGSGILAIAAAKLGYAPIKAIDFDPIAVRIARENARRNHVQDKIKFARQDLAKLSAASREGFDLVCANLVYDVLVAERRKIVNRLNPGGRLVLAGILTAQFAEVEAAFAQEGLKLVRAKTVKEWRSGAFDFS
jgi:ribosomal protein L11 methyltransferase